MRKPLYLGDTDGSTARIAAEEWKTQGAELYGSLGFLPQPHITLLKGCKCLQESLKATRANQSFEPKK